MKKFIETLKNCWKIEDLRQRLLITLLFTAIYRFGSFVVLPGINPSMLEKLQSGYFVRSTSWAVMEAAGKRARSAARYLFFIVG